MNLEEKDFIVIDEHDKKYENNFNEKTMVTNQIINKFPKIKLETLIGYAKKYDIYSNENKNNKEENTIKTITDKCLYSLS